MVYYVYIIETVNGTFYTGQTNDLSRRLDEHLSGDSRTAAYFRMHSPKYLVHVEEFDTRADAMRRERQIKRNRTLKMRLVGERRAIEDLVSSD
jgi:putative endonuclease